MNIDKLNEFDVLTGFRFVEAHEQTAECSDGGTRAISLERLRAWQSGKKKMRRKRNDCNKNHFNCIAIFVFCNVH